MKTKDEWNLSEKIESGELIVSSKGERILKEFIRRLKEEFEDEITEYSKDKIVKKIDKLAGNKLC